MDRKKFFAILLTFALLTGLCGFASPARAASPDDFAERYGPLLTEGLDGLTDWLNGQTEKLAPELRKALEGLDGDIFSDLRELVGDTKGLDDAQLRARIREAAEAHGIHLVDSQVEQLARLCRAMEKLDRDALREKAEALGKQLEDLASPGGLRGLWQRVTGALRSAVRWIGDTVGRWFS